MNRVMLIVGLAICLSLLIINGAEAAIVRFNNLDQGWSSPWNGRFAGSRNFVEDGIYLEAVRYYSGGPSIGAFDSTKRWFLSVNYFYFNRPKHGIVLQMADGSPFDLVSADLRHSYPGRAVMVHTGTPTQPYRSYNWDGWFGAGVGGNAPFETIYFADNAGHPQADSFKDLTQVYLGFTDLTGIDNIVLRAAGPVFGDPIAGGAGNTFQVDAGEISGDGVVQIVDLSATHKLSAIASGATPVSQTNSIIPFQIN